MTMSEYLPHAVAAEMPVSFGSEALKAQAVAARTYILASNRHENADICTDSACCLAYRSEDELRALWGSDYEKNMSEIQAAVAATDGQILTYRGKIIQSVFHASSAGSTESSAAVWAETPYLIAVSSPETTEAVPDLISIVRVMPEELAAQLDLSTEDEPSEWFIGIEEDAAGRVQTLHIAGQALSGRLVRSALGLKSTDFTVEFDGEAFVFSVLGNGHGVGMSQVGAKLLAAEGWSYDEILAHYYPGTELIAP